MPSLLNPNSELAQICEAFFEATLQEETGIEITTIDAFRARMILYRYRSENNRSEYANIQIRLSPDNPENDLWLLNVDEREAP